MPIFVTDRTRTGLGLNLDLCGERPAADCLSHGTTLVQLEAEVKGQKIDIGLHSVSPEIFSKSSAVLMCTLQVFVF